MTVYIHTPSKHRRSGTTMQKLKGRGDTKRYKDLREVLPGFPAKPFERAEDVESYVSGDKITCMLCGRLFRSLGQHLIRIHEMDVKDYRVRFNIPFRFPLSVAETRALRAENANRNNQDGRLERGAVISLANRRQHGRQKAQITKMGMDSHVARIKAVEPRGHQIATDYSWHLSQVAEVYDFRTVSPPDGELSWSAYKKRRRKDPVLQAAHQQARRRWEDQKRGAWKRTQREETGSATVPQD